MKKKTLSSVKKKLWATFSLYIKTRDNFTCFTCGEKGEGQGMHAGHFIPRSLGSELYFDETNVHAQCYHCNINLSGYGAEYARRMIDKYGKAEVESLHERKHKIRKFTIPELENMLKYYKELLVELQNK